MEGSVVKRQRTATACINCRKLKAKCNGRRPVCSRCDGYGYRCMWSERPNVTGGARTRHESAELETSSQPSSRLMKHAIQIYEQLARSLCHNSSEVDRVALDAKLSLIRQQFSNRFVLDISSEDIDISSQINCSHLTMKNKEALPNHRYLGEASDVRFFNSMKTILGEEATQEELNQKDLESYEQGVSDSPFRKCLGYWGVPPRELADEYVEVFFSTVHIAYPFISRPYFKLKYNRLWYSNETDSIGASSLGLMYTIFAIGAYYLSFPSRESTASHPHMEFFQQAQMFALSDLEELSLTRVCMLLTQCFYLLAVCRTDECWTRLGLAIRIAHAIGLHVENPRLSSTLDAVKVETRRRTWYSLYVLDRLLSLQLGRPPAIQDDDYNTELPSNADDISSEVSTQHEPPPRLNELDRNNYFLEVINLSSLIGHVMRGLYNVRVSNRSTSEALSCAQELDESLQNWKLKLPRILRFDLGHTFENSVVFQRQRNMLAIKYHHLRSLIHRPFLGPWWLRRSVPPRQSWLQGEGDMVIRLQQTCVSEARSMAHLLHKVPDERSLVQDFPWWQMISCLICASSILLVASACAALDANASEDASFALDEDAETCLKVFEALSVNSDAARIARNMMQGLKEVRERVKNGELASLATVTNKSTELEKGELPPQQKQAPHTTQGTEILPFPSPTESMPSLPMDTESQNLPAWPSEIWDSMTWSAQFVDASYNPFSAGL